MTSSKLYSRELMSIRRLKVLSYSDEQICREYRIPIPTIQKAKKEIQRKAVENKELHAFELAKLKDRLKETIDNMDSIAKDKNVPLADRLNSERIKVEALALQRDAIEASISSPDPYSALEKIVEQHRLR
jgi:hypothetical protein